jgi:hypothetical protein
MKVIVGATSVALCLACAWPVAAQQESTGTDQEITRLQAELARLPGGGQKERDDLEWRIIIAKINAKRASGEIWTLADLFTSRPVRPPQPAPAQQPMVQVAQPATPVIVPLVPTSTPPAVSSAVLSPMPVTLAAPRLAPGTTIDRSTASGPAAATLPVAPPRPAASAAAVTPVKATERAEAAAPLAAAQQLEIRLPNGIALTVPADISPDALRRLAAALVSQ